MGLEDAHELSWHLCKYFNKENKDENPCEILNEFWRSRLDRCKEVILQCIVIY
jgi:hypothetical protein